MFLLITQRAVEAIIVVKNQLNIQLWRNMILIDFLIKFGSQDFLSTGDLLILFSK